MKCGFCDKEMYAGRVDDYCGGCSVGYNGITFGIMTGIENKRDGSKHWKDIPNRCLLVVEKFTEEIQ